MKILQHLANCGERVRPPGPPHARRAWRRYWLLAGCGGLLAGSAGAELAQFPLLTSSAAVPPNIVFTLDDSGSMSAECAADHQCRHAQTGFIGVVPHAWGNKRLTKDTAAYTEAFKVCEVHDARGSCKKWKTQTRPALLGMQLRTAALNGLYYNPAVRYQPWLNADGSRQPQAPPSRAWHTVRKPSDGTVDLTRSHTVKGSWCTTLDLCGKDSQTFRPAVYYVLKPGRSGQRHEDFNAVLIEPGRSRYPRSASRGDCVRSTDACSYDEEIQNFANWFSYNRSRMDVAIAGTAEAFAAIPADFRVGYGQLNAGTENNVVDGQPNNTVRRGVRAFQGIDKAHFYTWLQRREGHGATPLRRALGDVGNYFMRKDNAGPWGQHPGSNDARPHLSCRRAFHILMTDGIWNGAGASGAAGREVDNQAGPRIEGPDGQSYQYQPVRPYRGGTAGTLADAAMYFWNRDLRPDLPNRVRPSAGNPAFWQHMVNYTVAFGVNGRLRNPQDLPALTSGEKDWGRPAANQDLVNIDDLWHAALNSRGRSLRAGDAVSYTAALRSIIDDIVGSRGAVAGVAVSTRDLRGDGVRYVPSYQDEGWVGELEARSLTDNSPRWSASAGIPEPAARQIFTAHASATGPVGLPFTWHALVDAGLDAELTRLARWPGGDLVDYIRGERRMEAQGWRRRVGRLGDIVNAAPVLVKDVLDEQYDFLSPSHPGRASYLRHLQAKKLRVGQVLVGANDGMLHAFAQDDGRETFAFVPRALLPRLHHLADPDYRHRFFVDGQLQEADVYDGATGQWRNAVVGAAGAGARSLFAIGLPVATVGAGDRLNPLNAAQSAPGARDIWWEVTAQSPGFEELGHVLTPPRVGLLPNGRWAVLVGNGYASRSGRAQLLVLDALTGALIQRIDTGAGSPGQPNGLGGIALLRDDAQRVQAVYGGDLQGRLWKFDFSTAGGLGQLAYAGRPVFEARNDQDEAEPITAPPALLRHPSGGQLVLLGTGQLFDAEDRFSVSQRSLYGVWDRDGTETPLSVQRLKRQQAGTRVLSSHGERQYFAVSGRAPDYGADDRGWVLRLDRRAGQRALYEPHGLRGLALFETVVPRAADDPCLAGDAETQLYALDAFRGLPWTRSRVFAESGHDQAAILSGHGGGRGALQMALDGRARLVTAGDNAVDLQLGSRAMRRSWRQIINPPR